MEIPTKSVLSTKNIIYTVVAVVVVVVVIVHGVAIDVTLNVTQYCGDCICSLFRKEISSVEMTNYKSETYSV